MRKRICMAVCVAIAGVHSVGCLIQALLNPNVTQGRLMDYIHEYPDEAGDWAHWFDDTLEGLVEKQ